MAGKSYINYSDSDQTIDIDGDICIEWGQGHAPDDQSTLSLDLSHNGLTLAASSGARLQIKYSSERDGWIISRQVTIGRCLLEDGVNYPVSEIREKAFIPAWEEDEVLEGHFRICKKPESK